MTPRIPRIECVTGVLVALTGAGLAPAVGGSGLLVALGVADVANDWDVTVDAAGSAVRAALDGAGIPFRDAAERDGIFHTEERFVVDGGDHDVDVLVNFALAGPDGPERLPVRITGTWRGLPLADPVVWQRAYQLLGRRSKAAAVTRWLAQQP